MILLIALGIALGAPGVGWYLVLRPAARGSSAGKDLRATLDAVPPASDIRAAPSIAVLPLVNMSKDPDQEYFADGLAEELLNLLAKVPGLRVAARTSAFVFKGKNADVAEIGQKLHVAHVLEGSVRRSGDQVRITTQLISASDGFHVWSETYDRKLAVWVRLDWAGGRADVERALALNPSDAVALRYYAGDVLMPPGKLPEAIAAARKATELDPLSTESWTILGWQLAASGRLDEGRQAVSRAVGISPGNDLAGMWVGLIDLLQGQPEKALARFTRLSAEWCRLTGVALAQHDLGHEREAHEALDKLQTAHAEDAAYQIAEVYSRRGEKDRALDWLERARAQRDAGLLFVKTDPFLSNGRGDPRYKALLKKMNLPPD